MGGGSQLPLMDAQRKNNNARADSTADNLADMDSSTSTAQEQANGTSGKDTVNIVVTGFGPFPSRNGGRYQQNASHLISRLLPSSIPPLSAQNPTKARINILNPTAVDGAYVRTEYAYVRNFVKELHEKYSDEVDLILHLGMANGWDHVTVERGAFKQGMSSSWWGDLAAVEYYLMPDDAGQTVKDLDDNPWAEVPIGLGTSLNVERVAGMAMEMQATSINRTSPTLPILPHIEAGPYLCGFIYYESMATCFIKKRRADVLFCHVPGETDEQSLVKGKNAIVAVIGAAASEVLSRREKQGQGAE